MSNNRKGLVDDGDPREPSLSEVMREVHGIRDDMQDVAAKVDEVHKHVVSASEPEKGLLIRVRDLEQKWATTAKVLIFIGSGFLLLLVQEVYSWFQSPPSPPSSQSRP